MNSPKNLLYYASISHSNITADSVKATSHISTPMAAKQLLTPSEETVSKQTATSAVQHSMTLIDNQTNYDSLNSLVEASRATVHGVVAQVSPMKAAKSGKTYFDTVLCDTDTTVRIVGFGDKPRELLREFEQTGETIDLQGCRIKRSRYSEDMEIMVNQHSAAGPSPKKMKIVPPPTNADIQLNDFSTVKLHRISFRAKVVGMEPPTIVAEGLKLQNAVVADSTLSVKLAIWQDDIGKIAEGSSYYFRNFVVKTFQGEKYIQWPKQGAEVEPIENIESTADDAPMFETITVSEVVGVSKFASYQACLSCKNKVNPQF